MQKWQQRIQNPYCSVKEQQGELISRVAKYSLQRHNQLAEYIRNEDNEIIADITVLLVFHEMCIK